MHNLPSELTSFVGRVQEVAEVRRLLSSSRLLTLTGAGGVGKTRLALHVARDVADAFPEGVWLTELAPLMEPAAVPQAVASAFGLRERPGRAQFETLHAFVAQRQLLLVLDNCEHLVGACAELAVALLAASPGLRVVEEAGGVPIELVLTPGHSSAANCADWSWETTSRRSLAENVHLRFRRPPK